MVAARNQAELPQHPAPQGGVPLAHGPHAVPQRAGGAVHPGHGGKVFEDFTYHREMASADGMSVVLEFSAKVNGKELKGIDMIQFDDRRQDRGL
jgi:2,4-dienoyl-CoA reductase (NADPH2)